MRISDWSSDVCSSDLLDAERVEPDALGIGDDADRDDRMAVIARLDLAVLGLDLRRHAGRARFQFLDTGSGQDRHALFFQRFLEEARHVGILYGDDAVAHLDRSAERRDGNGWVSTA